MFADVPFKAGQRERERHGCVSRNPLCEKESKRPARVLMGLLTLFTAKEGRVNDLKERVM